jgi:hypothetical protein
LKGVGRGRVLTSEGGGVGIHGRDARGGRRRSRSGRWMDGNGGDAGERAVLGLMETCEMGKVGEVGGVAVGEW